MLIEILDALANWLLSKEYKSSTGRFLSYALAGYAGGIFGGPVAVFISTFLLYRYGNPGIAEQDRSLGFLVTVVATAVLGILIGSPVGAIIAGFYYEDSKGKLSKRIIILGGFLGGCVLAIFFLILM